MGHSGRIGTRRLPGSVSASPTAGWGDFSEQLLAAHRG